VIAFWYLLKKRNLLSIKYLNMVDKYKWLLNEPGPKMLVEALKHYGVLEHPGHGSNPNILEWAKEIGVLGWYTDDDIPWCGLFMAIVAKRSGYPVPANSLRALSWSSWQDKVNLGDEKLGDTLVFVRPGGGHVGMYIGENSHAFLVYGGNQSNKVGFAFVAKERLHSCRRPIWKIGQPKNVRKILLTEVGELSKNES
jgi:uncharacterized protein (TIGR02594 family)